MFLEKCKMNIMKSNLVISDQLTVQIWKVWAEVLLTMLRGDNGFLIKYGNQRSQIGAYS